MNVWKVMFVVACVGVSIWLVIAIIGGALALGREWIVQCLRAAARANYDLRARSARRDQDGLRLEVYRLELEQGNLDGGWRDRRMLGIHAAVLDDADDYCRAAAARALGKLVEGSLLELGDKADASNRQRPFVEAIRRVMAEHDL